MAEGHGREIGFGDGWQIVLEVPVEDRTGVVRDTATAAIAIEQAFVGIDQKAWFVVFMQRAQPKPSVAAQRPGWPPVMSLQVVQQRNLALQLVENLAIHGPVLLSGRIRHIVARSQATMVGDSECRASVPTPIQHHRLRNRRCAHRRTVDASGERDESLQCGAASSAVAPAAICSHACCRQRKLKCAAGASQSGRMVKVFPHGLQIPRRAQMRSCRSSWACLSRRPCPTIVSP